MLKSSTLSIGRDGSEIWAHKLDGGGRGVASRSGSSEIQEAGSVGKPGRLEHAPERRPSVRDLASKFELKGQVAETSPRKAPTPPDTKSKVEDTSNEINFQKLSAILVDLGGRVTGRNKEDVEKALGTAETLQAKYGELETEWAKGRAEWENLRLDFEAANETVIELQKVLEERGTELTEGRWEVENLRGEVEAAKETVNSLQDVLQEQEKERMWAAVDSKELEELKREAQEARRIRMLHQSSRAVDTEQQINSLRQQLEEKVAETTALQHELEIMREQGRRVGKSPLHLLLSGDERLGSTLNIVSVNDKVSNLSDCTIQWYHIKEGGDPCPIAGAIRPQYAPEPIDVGVSLRAEVQLLGGNTQIVQTTGPIEPARALDQYVDNLASKGSAQFNVRIVLKNGETADKQRVHTLDVNKTRIKLHRSSSVKSREIYSTAMKLCGARGGGDSAAQGLFWVPKKDQTFMLVLESVRERNAAIILARRFAKLHNIELGGPGDLTHLTA